MNDNMKIKYFDEELEVYDERRIVNKNTYSITLNYVPSPTRPLIVENGKTTLTETNGTPNANQYVLDRENGLLLFNQAMKGKVVTINYSAIGLWCISADKVYTNVDNKGKIVETLEDLMKENRQAIESIKTVGDASAVITQLQANIDSVTGLVGNIAEGSSVNEELTKSITSGKGTNITLTNTISSANNKINEMNTWVNQHGDIVNLDNRVDTVETEIPKINEQLEHNSKKSEQYQGDLLELLYNYSNLKDKVAVRYRATNIIDVAVFYNNSNATVYTFSPDNDGWFRLKEAVKRPMTIEKTKAQKNYDSITGTWSTNSAPFHYTTEIGATFKGSFYGTGCFFKGRRSDKGGIWEIVVDGIYKKTVSCWGATESGYVEIPLFEGLEEGQHTIVGTFKGDDPDHIPSGGAGTSRGFINYSSSDGGIGYYYNNISQQSGIIVLDELSRKEFAFACKPASYSGSNVWIPEHGVFGVMKNIITKIYFGDRLITDLISEHTDYRFYPSVKIMSEFDAFHSTKNETPLWHGRIDHTINNKGVHIKGTFEFKQDTFIGIGHPAMFAFTKAYTKNTGVVDSYGNRHLLDWNVSNDTDVYVGEDSYCIAHYCEPSLVPEGTTIYDNQRDNVGVIKIYNYQRTMRLGEENRGGVYTRLKADDTRKTYYVSHRNHTALAGETFDFGCTYFIGDIFEAYKVLPNGKS